MDIPSIRPNPDPAAQAPVGLPQSSGPTPAPQGAGAAAVPGSSSAPAPGANPAPAPGVQAQAQAEALNKAVHKLNEHLAQSGPVTLSAGLDTSGQHPGQVLVELSDKQTQQTFFKYYLPAQQVIEASQPGPAGGGAQPGALLNTKA